MRFDTPGTVLTVTLTINPWTMSATVKDMQQPVATVATTGTFVASVVPAMRIPLESEGECEVLLEAMEDASGAGSAPQGESPLGEEGASEEANAGADDSQGQTATDEVRVTLVDAEGQAISGETVVFRRASGEEESHALDDDGTLVLEVEEGETLDVHFPNVPHAQVKE